jgi:hypothetical protein
MAYGLSILNASGTTEIFGHNTSNAHFLATGDVTVPAASGGTPGETSAISCEGMTATNTDEVGLAVYASNYLNVNAVRTTGSFKLTNTHTSQITAKYLAYRI